MGHWERTGPILPKPKNVIIKGQGAKAIQKIEITIKKEEKK
jgi:hypothetical protein